MSRELSRAIKIKILELFALRQQIEELAERSRDTNQIRLNDQLHRLFEPLDKAIEGLAFDEAVLAWRSQQESG